MPRGYVGGVQCDPIEKKPFFHARPGALAFSFGMLGCDLHCSYCQNWVTSQALRDPRAASPPLDVTPEALADQACQLDARLVVSTYNEPLITSEWAVAIFKEARRAWLMTAYVSNGNGTPASSTTSARGSISTRSISRASTIATTVQLGGRLEPILTTIRALHAHGDLARDRHAADSRLQRLARGDRPVDDVRGERVARHPVARDGVPQGLPDERSRQHDARDARRRRGDRAGATVCDYVYAGNLPGQVGDLENTRCHACRALLVERVRVSRPAVPSHVDGQLPGLRRSIPGRWGARYEGQVTDTPFLPGRRHCGPTDSRAGSGANRSLS